METSFPQFPKNSETFASKFLKYLEKVYPGWRLGNHKQYGCCQVKDIGYYHVSSNDYISST